MRGEYFRIRRKKKEDEARVKGNCLKCFKRKRWGARVCCRFCIRNGLALKKKARQVAGSSGLCRKCKKAPAAPDRASCVECLVYVAAAVKEYQRKLRRKVLEHYSGGKPHCRCCGEDHPVYLTIDHVDDDGAKHRREAMKIHKNREATSFYLSVIKGGFTHKLQILCWNCQWAKRLNGGICPRTGIDMRIPAVS